MTALTEEEWRQAEEAARNELACAYANGELDVAKPVDANLKVLARRIVRGVLTSTGPFELGYTVTTDTPQSTWKC